MQTHHAALIAASLLAGAALPAQTAPAPASAPAAAPAPADAITAAFTKGKVSLSVRPRFESVEQSNRADADAFTVRTALGFTTAPLHGFTASIELEDVTAANEDDYAAAPNFSTTTSAPAVIADPDGTEVNQVWLAYKAGDTTVKAGRFALVLDNARFIGNVGWRQNMQTFDGAMLQNKSVEKLTLTYAYLDRINRIFGDDIPTGNWTSDSHVFNASYAGLSFGTLTGYAYLLDFDNAAANSTATYGASFAGAAPVADGVKLTYRGELATQSDYGSSALDYTAEYFLGELGVVLKPVTVAAGYELLGTDNGVGFKTPLATLHAFNGWADLFLNTPGGGLEDTYVKVGATLPGAVSLLAFYHMFETDTGIDLGDEIDVQVSRKFGKYFTLLAKYSDFDRDGSTTLVPESVKKFWVQLEFAY